MASDESTEDLNLYFYNPSTPLAIVFSVLYLILTIYHFHLSIIYPRKQPLKHRYTIPLFVAALISTAGWAVRVVSINSKSSIPLYAVSASYIVISPIFVCATLYLLLTRLIRASLGTNDNAYETNNNNNNDSETGKEGVSEPSFLGIPARWLGRVFITSDIFSFLTQCSGSGIASSGNWEGNLKTVGTNVLLVGLALQLATFSVFMLVLYMFVRRVKNTTITTSVSSTTSYRYNRPRRGAGFDPHIKKVVLGVWIASVFVQTRSIYRVVEFGLGIDGYPFKNEWCLYVLEAVPMWIAIAVLGWFHPVKLLQPQHRGHRQLHSQQDNIEGVGVGISVGVTGDIPLVGTTSKRESKSGRAASRGVVQSK